MFLPPYLCSVRSWLLVLLEPKANVVFASFSSRRLKVIEVSGKRGAGVCQLVSTSLALQLCHSETGPTPASPLDFKPGSHSRPSQNTCWAFCTLSQFGFNSSKKKKNLTHLFFSFQFSFFYAELGQSQASGDQVYHSFLRTAFWWPSCGDTLCSTRRPERVSEMPTHHSVIWASPKISCPRKACRKREKHTLEAAVHLHCPGFVRKDDGRSSGRSLTEDMKLEAVVVTVVQVEEEEYLSALARKVHITALQVKRSPPHSSLRGMWS